MLAFVYYYYYISQKSTQMSIDVTNMPMFGR